jgi:FMN phosphatase YigB (HAD superfamily)
MAGCPATARWATFDCYGTLIDWNTGIGRELARLFSAEVAPRLLQLYHELEPQVQGEHPQRSYREVLDLTLARLADRNGLGSTRRSRERWPARCPAGQPSPKYAKRWRTSVREAGGWRSCRTPTAI